ncbi:hypothetical protein [uncultured Pseudomonas sp.]|uniref:hypothetical protein n=1 Tax=uncultured Pseudomonas sp. TaxID=114707 RepID=UPI0025DC1072|nr:hypothetical protein [uncultured Pseudomonas sp.]
MNEILCFKPPATLFVGKGPDAVREPQPSPVRLDAQSLPGTQIVLVAERGRQGPQGEIGPAGGASFTVTAVQTLSGHRVVYAVDDDHVDYASCLVAANATQVLGVTTGAIAANDQGTVQRMGLMTHEGWAWTAGPVFVGADGQLTQSLPVGARFSLPVGFAPDATSIYLDIGMPIFLEA